MNSYAHAQNKLFIVHIICRKHLYKFDYVSISVKSENHKNSCSKCLFAWCLVRFCAVLCVCFCTGHFCHGVLKLDLSKWVAALFL